MDRHGQSGVIAMTRLFVVLATIAGLLVAQPAPGYAAALRPPTGLTVSAVTDTSATISWQAASGATGYDVLRGRQSGGPYTLVGHVTALSYPDSGLAPATAYYYVVRSTSGGRTSQNSAQLAVTTTITPATGLRHTAFPDHVDLSWAAAPGAVPW